MAILPRQQILSLHTAVVAVRLSKNRETLLGGIDATFVDTLPIASDSSAQILSDLHALNQTVHLSDGSVPLRIWIENAINLVGAREEVHVFHRALQATQRVKTRLDVTSSPDVPVQASAVDALLVQPAPPPPPEGQAQQVAPLGAVAQPPLQAIPAPPAATGYPLVAAPLVPVVAAPLVPAPPAGVPVSPLPTFMQAAPAPSAATGYPLASAPPAGVPVSPTPAPMQATVASFGATGYPLVQAPGGGGYGTYGPHVGTSIPPQSDNTNLARNIGIAFAVIGVTFLGGCLVCTLAASIKTPTTPAGQAAPTSEQSWITSDRPYVKFLAAPGWNKSISGDWGVCKSPDGNAAFAFTTFSQPGDSVARLGKAAGVLGVGEVDWHAPVLGAVGKDHFSARMAEGSCNFGGPGGYIWYATVDSGTSDQMLLIYTVGVRGSKSHKDAALTVINSLQRR